MPTPWCFISSRPISQIPQCIRQISHNVTFCNRKVHTCAHFCYKMVHCGDMGLMHYEICATLQSQLSAGLFILWGCFIRNYTVLYDLFILRQSGPSGKCTATRIIFWGVCQLLHQTVPQVAPIRHIQKNRIFLWYSLRQVSTHYFFIHSNRGVVKFTSRVLFY